VKEHEYTWYFEIAKEAEMAYDEHGNFTSCYSKVAMSFKEEKDADKLDSMTPHIRNHLADTADMPVGWIKPITAEEYNVEED
jgi:hypothetical protein